MQRLGRAMAAGILTGGVVALVAGLMFDPFELVGTWGVVNGIVVSVLVFFFVLARGRGWQALAGRWLLALALGVVSWWAMFFALGTTPLSLEGAWLWPLAVLCVSAFVVVSRWSWRSTRTQSRPESSPGRG